MSKFHIPDMVIYVCTGHKCAKRGGKHLCKSARAFGKYTGQDLEVIETECIDRCEFAPVCSIQPANIWLKKYSEKEIIKLLKQLAEPEPEHE